MVICRGMLFILLLFWWCWPFSECIPLPPPLLPGPASSSQDVSISITTDGTGDWGWHKLCLGLCRGTPGVCRGPAPHGKKEKHVFLTSLLRMPYKPAIYFSIVDRRMSWHAFVFLRVCAGAMSTRHTWPWHCAGWRVYTQMFLAPVPLMYQPRICKDGLISIVFDVSSVCCLFDWALVDNRPLLRSLPTV